jgi:LPXTG-motif cell wall-anchored protein
MTFKVVSPYPKQWGQLFMLLSSNSLISKSVVEALIREALPGWEFQPFSFYETTTRVEADSNPDTGGTIKQLTGPWAGRDMPGTSVMSLKAVGRTKERVALLELPTGETDLGRARATIRALVYPKLEAQGIYVSYFGFSPYGAPSTSTQALDKGLPVNPDIPPEPPPSNWFAWLAALFAGGTAVVLIRKKQKER